MTKTRWLLIVLFARSAAAEQITFNKSVAPIIFGHCSACHRPGEAGPFALLTYADVRKHAQQIVAVTESRYMPPWLPRAGYGEFRDERRLSDRDLKTIAEWVTQGALEGDAADLLPPPAFTEGWQLGPPDLVVQLPKPIRIPATGADVFRNFVLPVNLAQSKYVQAMELRPGNNRLVHHANIWIDQRHTLRSRDGEDGEPGFPGMETLSTEARSDDFDPASHFLFWKPGSVVTPERDGMSWRLDARSDLILNLHVQPSGKEEFIQPAIGLYFTSQAPRLHPMLVQLEHDGAINIPAGARDAAVTDRLTLPTDVEVMAIYPHAHYLGKRLEAWATRPDGVRIPLIRIDDWDMNWQAVYPYRNPVSLPKGTTIEMSVTFDNSAMNGRNPSHPPVHVRAGPTSRDEMGHVWLQVLPKQESGNEARALIQEALMLRRLEKYPGDFAANCNLGAIAVMRGQYTTAAARYQGALAAQPISATARNGLGASLLSERRYEDAIRELRAALRIEPSHRHAQLNLAKALAMSGELAGAAAVLETFVSANPMDAEGHSSLAMVYLLGQRQEDALPHFRAAIRLNPKDPASRLNLGVLLANRGDLTGAIEQFENAAALDPSNIAAQDNLSRARAQLRVQR